MKIKNLFIYFTDTIFRRNINSFRSPRIRWAVKQYKLLFYTARGLIEHDTIVRSAALTFYTIISLVPILALIFAVVKGFGLIDGLIQDLYAVLPQNKAVVDYIIQFAERALATTRGGVLAVFSIATLFWAVIRVFGSVEKAFNNIWEVRSSRNIARQYVNYLVLVIIAPILWLIASALGNYALELFAPQNALLSLILTKISALLIIWGMFTLIYVVVPNTKVQWRAAWRAGIIAGTFFLLFQWGYVYAQQWMSSYNTIYGSFAAIPLFMFWIQISWEILLFGGELSFAYQNISRFDEERESLKISLETRRQIILAIMLCIMHRFRQGESSVSISEIKKHLSLPTRIVNDILYQLVRTKLLVESNNQKDKRETAYTPGRDIHEMTIYNILETVDRKGTTHLHLANTEEMRQVENALKGLHTTIRSESERIRIIDLDDSILRRKNR